MLNQGSPEREKVEPVNRSGGAIIDFRIPKHRLPVSVATDPSVTDTPSNIIEGLFTDSESTPPTQVYSKEEILRMALNPAEKAA